MVTQGLYEGFTMWVKLGTVCLTLAIASSLNSFLTNKNDLFWKAAWGGVLWLWYANITLGLQKVK